RAEYAGVTVTTRSVSTSAGATRSVTPPAEPSSTRSSASASWTMTRPRKRRLNSGRKSIPISRGGSRWWRPVATSTVSCATPSVSSSSTAATIASCRGSKAAAGTGRWGGSITTVAVPPRTASRFNGSPASGKRTASRTAARTSAIARPGRGGRRTTPSAAVSTTAIRVPERSGTRGIRRYVRRAAAAVAPSEAQHSERDQVGGADELDDGERVRRRRDLRREADCRGGDVNEAAARDPGRRDEAGAAPLVEALRHDVRHGRSGHDDQRQGSGGE